MLLRICALTGAGTSFRRRAFGNGGFSDPAYSLPFGLLLLEDSACAVILGEFTPYIPSLCFKTARVLIIASKIKD